MNSPDIESKPVPIIVAVLLQYGIRGRPYTARQNRIDIY